MEFYMSFLQRLIKKCRNCKKVFINFLIEKINTLTDCTEQKKKEMLKRCQEFASKNKKTKVRNFIAMRIGKSTKNLVACIMDFKVVVKCKKCVIHFVNKINPNILFKSVRSVVCASVVMFVAIVMVFTFAQGEELGYASVSDEVTDEASPVAKKENMNTGNIVVDEETAQERFDEVILQEKCDEEVVTVKTKSYEAYVEAVTESVLTDKEIEAQKEDMNVKIVEKEISVMDINAYNLEIKYGITEEELRLFQRIVEAEAGGEDLKGRILVANVVLNRVKADEFPDSVKSVILQQENGKAQFSPVTDGRLWSVTVSDTSKEAVQRALDGEDYSQGALYFMERAYAKTSNWFDQSLTRLFKHGCHEFFK